MYARGTRARAATATLGQLSGCLCLGGLAGLGSALCVCAFRVQGFDGPRLRAEHGDLELGRVQLRHGVERGVLGEGRFDQARLRCDEEFLVRAWDLEPLGQLRREVCEGGVGGERDRVFGSLVVDWDVHSVRLDLSVESVESVCMRICIPVCIVCKICRVYVPEMLYLYTHVEVIRWSSMSICQRLT